MYLFCNNIHCLKYLKTSQFPSIYIYTNQARTFIMCRTLIIFYVLFRPGHLLSTGRLFFLMQSSGQDAYLGTPFIRYRRVPIQIFVGVCAFLNCRWVKIEITCVRISSLVKWTSRPRFFSYGSSRP